MDKVKHNQRNSQNSSPPRKCSNGYNLTLPLKFPQGYINMKRNELITLKIHLKIQRTIILKNTMKYFIHLIIINSYEIYKVKEPLYRHQFDTWDACPILGMSSSIYDQHTFF